MDGPPAAASLPNRVPLCRARQGVHGWRAGRAGAGGRFDMTHLDVSETRGNGECTMRRGRLGRRRRGEKTAGLTAEHREQTKESARLDKLLGASLEDIGCGS